MTRTESPRTAARRIVREVLHDHARDDGPLGDFCRAEIARRSAEEVEAVRGAFVRLGRTVGETAARVSAMAAGMAEGYRAALTDAAETVPAYDPEETP